MVEIILNVNVEHFYEFHNELNKRSLLLGKKMTFHKWLYKAIQETANRLKIKILADFKKTQKVSAYERLG